MAVDKVARKGSSVRSSSAGGSSPDPATAANTDAALYVNDIAVLSSQQSSIANCTTGAANSNNVGDAPTKLNLILVALRAHGLIAS